MGQDAPIRVCRCRHPEVLDLAAAEYRWPAGTIVTWWVDPAALPASLTLAEVRQSAAAGIAPWPLACGVQVAEVLDQAEARVIIRFGPIDGQWNVLGETELPAEGSAAVQHTMLLDSAEAWTPDFLRRVILHEFGHAIGLGHAPSPIVAVMSPVYNDQLDAPQPWDSQEGQDRYGPAPQPVPSPAAETPERYVLPFSVSSPGRYNLQLNDVQIDAPGSYFLIVYLATGSPTDPPSTPK